MPNTQPAATGGYTDPQAVAAATAGIHASGAKSPPVDNDEIAIIDSASGNILAKVLWSVVKSTLKTYFDGIYGGALMFTKNITSAANAGAVTVATVGTQACRLKSVVVKANAAQTTDLGSIKVTCGASNVVTLIDIVTGVYANIKADDQQVSWTGAVDIDVADTIVITLAGSEATAVNLQVTIEYEAIVSGGTLA